MSLAQRVVRKLGEFLMLWYAGYGLVALFTVNVYTSSVAPGASGREMPEFVPFLIALVLSFVLIITGGMIGKMTAEPPSEFLSGGMRVGILMMVVVGVLALVRAYAGIRRGMPGGIELAVTGWFALAGVLTLTLCAAMLAYRREVEEQGDLLG